MATTQQTDMTVGHGIDVSDLDLTDVPATHRHAIRALRTELSDIEDISIDHVCYTGTYTTVFLDIRGASNLLGTYDIRHALSDTGVDHAELRTGSHTSVQLGFCLGFEV